MIHLKTEYILTVHEIYTDYTCLYSKRSLFDNYFDRKTRHCNYLLFKLYVIVGCCILKEVKNYITKSTKKAGYLHFNLNIN